MDFFNYTTTYNATKKIMGKDAYSFENFYRETFYLCKQRNVNLHTIAQMEAEKKWSTARRPYYNIYPKIAESLSHTSLECPGNLIKLPLDTLCVRFSKKQPFYSHGQTVHSFLATQINITNKNNEEKNGLVVWVDLGEVVEQIPIMCYRSFPLNSKYVQDCFPPRKDSKCDISESEEGAIDDVLRILVSICLIDKDHDLITVDVLTKDLEKYEKTKDEKYVNRAHHRGKIGWNVGANIEVSPHLRRPHFAIRWTGRGSKIPKLRPIKGSVVNKKKIMEVPTGYQG